MNVPAKAAVPQTPPILYLDNHLLVVLKSPGLLSQSDSSGHPDLLTLLKAEIKIRFNKPGDVFLGLVHRLDRPVGGVMVFARTSKAASRLSAQIRAHQFAKYYLAVVDGCPEPAAGRLADILVKDRGSNRSVVAEKEDEADHGTGGGGQEAWLDYRLLQHRSDLNRSLLAIRLGTGRSHQIRLQLSSRGWPIVGDRRYHPDFATPSGIDQPTGSAGRRQPGQTHQPKDPALFACSIGFYHPISREWLTFAAPPPDRSPWNDFSVTDVRQITDWFML